MDNYNFNEYMKKALDEARKTHESQDVPIGAIIVKNGEVIAMGHNEREACGDATAHAEIQAIRKACERLGGWHLDNCELYVTLEPCPMCMGAIVNSRIKRVVFGAKDAKAGACGSVFNFNNYPLNHKPEIISGVLEEEGRALLSDFFIKRREEKKTNKS